ncbi:hypothetical protein [Paenibacillus sp. FSL K6-2862]|uniref:hypothetical protein n=1 Tax=Paenibacillus sp. FSL K6-2862 TaxID=2921484 RepID=UPI0030F5E595
MSILKEFDLDIPYINSGTPEDYEANWKQKRIQFRDEIRCVASLVERSFEQYKTSDSWKVLIEVVDVITDPGVKDFSGVCRVQVQFHVDTFFSKNDEEKKEATLDLMRRGIYSIILAKGWDSVPFERALEIAKNQNLINEWYWKKPLVSSNRKYKASLYIVHEVKGIKGILIVANKNNEEILRVEAFRDRPNEWAYLRFLGKLEWSTHNEVVLLDKRNNVVGKATVNKPSDLDILNKDMR